MIKNQKRKWLIGVLYAVLFYLTPQAKAGDIWLNISIPSFKGKHFCSNKVMDAHATIDIHCDSKNNDSLTHSVRVRRDEPFFDKSIKLNYIMDNETQHFTTVIYFEGPINQRDQRHNYFSSHWNKGLEGSVMEFEELRHPDDFLQDFVEKKTMQIRMKNACGGVSHLYFDIEKVGDAMLASSRVCSLRKLIDRKKALQSATAH